MTSKYNQTLQLVTKYSIVILQHCYSKLRHYSFPKIQLKVTKLEQSQVLPLTNIVSKHYPTHYPTCTFFVPSRGGIITCGIFYPKLTVQQTTHLYAYHVKIVAKVVATGDSISGMLWKFTPRAKIPNFHILVLYTWITYNHAAICSILCNTLCIHIQQTYYNTVTIYNLTIFLCKKHNFFIKEI